LTTSPRSYTQADGNQIEGDNSHLTTANGEKNGTADDSQGQEKGRMLLILNGKQAVKWSVLDAKVRFILSLWLDLPEI
jgi:hypothetical protein